jgi:activator of HSP90 ATPase
MSLEFEVAEVIPVEPEQLYSAWLSSEEHTNMTGSPAKVSNVVGGEFEAWDGYIEGVNAELEYPNRIVQRWRTTEFSDEDPDSRLEIQFSQEENGTRITIRHSQLPEHGMQYKQGWIDAYFTPMKAYFGKSE